MRENRLYGSEGGEPQTNAVFLPLSINSQPIRESCVEIATFAEQKATFGLFYLVAITWRRSKSYIPAEPVNEKTRNAIGDVQLEVTIVRLFSLLSATKSFTDCGTLQVSGLGLAGTKNARIISRRLARTSAMLADRWGALE